MAKWYKRLGPGLITGSSDDDPSGIATYSITGAQFGYVLNWLTLFLLPVMIVLQEMSARVGMVSGSGLAGVLRKFYPRNWLITATFLLAIANVINIGADLGIIAASLQMVLGQPFLFWLVLVTVGIIVGEIFVSYRVYSRLLVYGGMILGVYIITAFLVPQNWSEIAVSTLVPHIIWDKTFLATMVAFIGTTVSPYLLFWQASEEVEEEISRKQTVSFGRRPRIWGTDIKSMRIDTAIGMFFSNLVTFFIILTTTATLHQYGIMNIDSPQQAALALRPLAGDFAYWLFAVGVIGIGLQAIPVLSGSVAYAISEAFHWKEGLSRTFKQATGFYLVIGVATVIGALINLIGINPMRALYYTAIINGLVVVPLIFMLIKVADNKRVVGKYTSPPISRWIAWIAFGAMSLAVVFMLVSWIWQ